MQNVYHIHIFQCEGLEKVDYLPYERIAAASKWKSIGEVLITGVLNKGDIDKTDGCAQAAALADKF